MTPRPLWFSYPTILADLPAPKLRAYPKATAVAEKLHAIIAAFERRETALPQVLPLALTVSFAGDAAKQRQGSAFLTRNKLEGGDLSAAITAIRAAYERLLLNPT